MRTLFRMIAIYLLFAGPSVAVNDVASPLISLADSLSPIRNQFNIDHNKFQVVALLSPT